MFYIFLLLTGYIVGFLSSFFGIGGGSLIIPVLYSLLPDSPHTFIIATSLGAIFLNTSLNSFRFFKQGLTPKFKIVLAMFSSITLGSLIAYFIVDSINKAQAKYIFSFILILMILRIVFTKNKISTSDQINEVYSPQKMMITFFIGSIVSGVTGLGGGIIFVPMLMSFVKVRSMHLSIYSNLAMMITAATGIIGYFFKTSPAPLPMQIGSVNVTLILLLFIGSIFSSKLGVKYNSLIKDHTKKKLLIALLLLLAIKNII